MRPTNTHPPFIKARTWGIVLVVLALAIVPLFIANLKPAKAFTPTVCNFSASSGLQTGSISVNNGDASETFSLSIGSTCNVVGNLVVIGIGFTYFIPQASTTVTMTDTVPNTWKYDITQAFKSCVAIGGLGQCTSIHESSFILFSTALTSTATTLSMTIHFPTSPNNNPLMFNYLMFASVNNILQSSCTNGWGVATSGIVVYGSNYDSLCNVPIAGSGIMLSYSYYNFGGVSTIPQDAFGVNPTYATQASNSFQPDSTHQACPNAISGSYLCSVTMSYFLNDANPVGAAGAGWQCTASCGSSNYFQTVNLEFGGANPTTVTTNGIHNTQCAPACNKSTATSTTATQHTSSTSTSSAGGTSTIVHASTTTIVSGTTTTVIVNRTTTLSSAGGTTTTKSSTATSFTTNTAHTNNTELQQFIDNDKLYFYNEQNGASVSANAFEYNFTLTQVSIAAGGTPAVFGAIYLTQTPTSPPSSGNPYVLKWFQSFKVAIYNNSAGDIFLNTTPNVSICANCYYAVAFMANSTASNSITVSGSGIGLAVFSTSLTMDSYPSSNGAVPSSYFSNTAEPLPLYFYSNLQFALATTTVTQTVSVNGTATSTVINTVTTYATDVGATTAIWANIWFIFLIAFGIPLAFVAIAALTGNGSVILVMFVAGLSLGVIILESAKLLDSSWLVLLGIIDILCLLVAWRGH